MADANIQLPSLPSAVSANNSDLMLIRQGTEDKKATIQVIKDRILNGRDYTAAEILDLIKTVDGAGSGLDADLLDGQQGAFYQNASNLNAGIIPQARISAVDILALLQGVDGPGSDLNADLLDNQHGSFYQNANNLNAGTVPSARLSASALLSLINTVDGPGSDLNADLLDNQHGSFYQNASNLNAGTISSARVSGNYPNANINASNLYTGTVPGARISNASTSVAGKIEIATQSEVNAGSDNSRAVTPATLSGAMNALTGITAVAGNNGRLKIPYSTGNAIMIQWGSVSLAGNTSFTITFPESFSDVYQAFVTSTENSVNADAPTNPSLSNTQIGVTNGAGGSATVRWMAIGRKAI